MGWTRGYRPTSTSYDPGFGNYLPPAPRGPSYGDGVVTPHAVFLALPYAQGPALADLAPKVELRRYGDGGFYDAVAVEVRPGGGDHLPSTSR